MCRIGRLLSRRRVFNITQYALKIVEKYKRDIGIHTLVTPDNMKQLKEMAEYLKQHSYYNRISYWLLKKFKKINKAINANTEAYEIDDDLYHSAIDEVWKCYPELLICESDRDDIRSKDIVTLFISINGNIYIYKKGQPKNTLIGNVLYNDLASILLWLVVRNSIDGSGRI